MSAASISLPAWWILCVVCLPPSRLICSNVFRDSPPMHQSHVKSSGSRCWLLLLATILVWPALLPATSQDWETKAKEALENGQLEEARSLSEKALVDSAFAPAAHELLGRIALKQQRNEEAISHFESARDRGRSTEIGRASCRERV